MRRRTAVLLIAGALLATGCGADDEPGRASTTGAGATGATGPTTAGTPAPTATATPGTTTTPPDGDERPTATTGVPERTAPPGRGEEQEGGGGDEAARDFGSFVFTGDTVDPGLIEVPAGLGGVIAFESGDGRPYELSIEPPIGGRDSVSVPGSGRVRFEVPGLRPGQYRFLSTESQAQAIVEAG